MRTLVQSTSLPMHHGKEVWTCGAHPALDSGGSTLGLAGHGMRSNGGKAISCWVLDP